MRLTVLPTSNTLAAPAVERLADRFGRGIGYLRLSLTKACSMRCTYCRPARIASTRDEPTLSPQEIESLVEYLTSRHGLRKVRLTGGDPTSRRELTEIIARVACIGGIRDLAMTTNGLTLVNRAREYRDAGLRRVNVSLDTLCPQRFAELTGVDGLDRVLRGLDAAREVGLWPIRLNTVVIRGSNDGDLPDLVRFAAANDYEIRFIELMPMGPLASSWKQRYVPESDMRASLEPVIRRWMPLEQGHDAARRYRVALHDDAEAVIGFITPMSCNFCSGCNRIRIAADGGLYPCLMDRPAGSLLPALRPRFDPGLLDAILAGGLRLKREEHPRDGYATMTHIGG